MSTKCLYKVVMEDWGDQLLQQHCQVIEFLKQEVVVVSSHQKDSQVFSEEDLAEVCRCYKYWT